MRKLGYIYRPAILPPTAEERSRLQAAGASELLVDLGDRQHYLRLIQEYGRDDASELTLLLLSLTDLGETTPKVEQQVQFWLHQGADVRVLAVHEPMEASQFGDSSTEELSNNEVAMTSASSERDDASRGQTDGAVEDEGMSELGQSLRDLDVLSACLAQLPQELKGRHIAEGHAQNRLNRKPPPGPAPFGYRRVGDTYEIDESSAQLVRSFFERFLLFGSIRGAVKEIVQEQGGSISVTTARRWLTSPVYRGDLKFKDGVTLRDTHPALLSREEAAQIDRWSRRNSPIASRSTSAPRALAGLVVCQSCDRPLRIVQATRKKRANGVNSAKVYRYLRCTSCKYSVNYDLALTNTIQAVCQQLPERTENLEDVPIESIKSRIELQIERNKAKINALDTQSELEIDPQTGEGDRQWQRYQLEGENAKLSEKRDQLPPGNLAAIAQAVSIEPFWRSLSESEQRAYLREFIKQISINSDGEVKLEFFF